MSRTPVAASLLLYISLQVGWHETMLFPLIIIIQWN